MKNWGNSVSFEPLGKRTVVGPEGGAGGAGGDGEGVGVRGRQAPWE